MTASALSKSRPRIVNRDNTSRSSFFIGTSGWHYMDWRGIFYPKDMKPPLFLSHYVKTFKTVELNGTFYHLPKDDTARLWHNETPEDFVFAVKANRFITHIKRLHDVQEPLTRFMKWADLLKEKRGPILFQFPPHWRRNRERLESFLKLLPADHLYVCEFRDPSWYSEEIYDLLRAHHVAFCVYDMQGKATPLEVTSSIVYIRFHGAEPHYHGDYTRDELRTWAHHINGWLVDKKKIFAYFNNDFEGHAPKNANELLPMIKRPR